MKYKIKTNYNFQIQVKRMRAQKTVDFRTLILVLLFSGLGVAHPVRAQVTTGPSTSKTIPSITATPSSVKTPVVETVMVKKDFKWFFKNGCNCPQCRAFRQQQLDDQQRLKDNFQP